MPAVQASDIASHLWAILGKYGYHIGRNGRVEALRVGAEFNTRIQGFVGNHLMRDKYLVERTWGSLKYILYLDKRKGKAPCPRDEVVGNWVLNELTLVWACYFLFNSYYRVSVDEVLKALKVELVWLLREFGYPLDSEHTLVCPRQEWERQTIWPIVSKCDALSLEYAVSDNEEVERLIPSCDECPVRFKFLAAR